jgi:hypothetical protein
MKIDMTRFPSMDAGVAVIPAPNEALKAWPELYDRCCAAVYFASQCHGESTKHILSDEAFAAAYVRAALAEFVGIEDCAVSILGEMESPAAQLYKSENPLYHCLKLLRNYNIHVGVSSLASQSIDVIFVGENHKITVAFIDNIDPRAISKLHSAEKYSLAELELLFSAFDSEQKKLGVGQLMMRGVYLYADLLGSLLTKRPSGRSKNHAAER